MASVVVIGAGPGLGNAVARRFAREGFAVVPLARRRSTVEATERDLAPFQVPVLPLTADATDEPGLRAALRDATDRFGTPWLVNISGQG